MARRSIPATDDAIPSFDLLGLEGPGEGLHVELDPDVELLVGRGLKGLEVPDPQVSLQHAVVEWRGNRFTITDLNSATGTEVDGQRIPANVPTPLKLGSRLKFGNSSFEVVERHREWRRVAEMAVLGAMITVVIGALVWMMAPKRDLQVGLVWIDPIRQGAKADAILTPDNAFLRMRGIDPFAVRIRRVTDVDQDGVDEVWLLARGKQYVVSFDEQGNWVDLGTIPAQCADVRNSGAGWLPELDCGRVTWGALAGGPYQPLIQNGIVLWGTSPGDWEQPGPPPAELAKVRWGTLRRPSMLAGFLAANGLGEPVHYIVCEHVFPGVPALALTARGEIKALGVGCRESAVLKGGDLSKVSAVALSHTGHKALVEDVNVLFGGSPDGLFRSAEADGVIQAWAAPPEDKSNQLLTFTGPDHFLDPVAKEQPLTARVAWPAKFGSPASATTASIVGTGTVQVDPPGCSVLEVTTAPWHCGLAQGCMSSSTFVTVTEVGCKPGGFVAQAPYATTRQRGTTDGLDIVLDVTVSEDAERLDVVRTRVGWRPRGG